MGEVSVRVFGSLPLHPLRLALTYGHFCGGSLATAGGIVLDGGGAIGLAAGCGIVLPGRGEVRGARQPAAATLTTCALGSRRELQLRDGLTALALAGGARPLGGGGRRVLWSGGGNAWPTHLGTPMSASSSSVQPPTRTSRRRFFHGHPRDAAQYGGRVLVGRQRRRMPTSSRRWRVLYTRQVRAVRRSVGRLCSVRARMDDAPTVI